MRRCLPPRAPFAGLPPRCNACEVKACSIHCRQTCLGLPLPLSQDFLTEVLTNNGGSIDAARAALRDMGCRERPQPLLSPSAPAPPLHAPPRWQQPAGVGSGAGPSTSTGFGLGIFAAGGGYGAEGAEEDTSALRSNRMGQQGPAGGLAAGRSSAYGQAEQGAQARCVLHAATMVQTRVALGNRGEAGTGTTSSCVACCDTGICVTLG